LCYNIGNISWGLAVHLRSIAAISFGGIDTAKEHHIQQIIPRKDSIIKLEIYPNLPDETVPVFILKCLWGLDNLGVIAAQALR
jgi:hypothetical protein